MLDVILDPEAEAFVAAQVASGRFRTAAEVVHAGLSLLAAHEADASDETPLHTIDEEIAASIRLAFAEEGPDIPADAFFDALEARIAADLEADRRNGA